MLPPPPPAAGQKRKTLAEKGGEVARPAPHPPGSRVNNGGVKGATLGNLSRQGSLASSTSTRPGSSASNSRSTSNSSWASSFGRGPATGFHRPHSSMSSASTIMHPLNSRTATGVGQFGRNGRAPQMPPKADSMPPLPLSTRRCGSSFPRERYSNRVPSGPTPTANACSDSAGAPLRGKSLRDISVSSALKGLSLDPKPSFPPPPVSNGNCRSPSPSHIPKKKSSITSLCGSAAASPRKTPKAPRITGVGAFLTVETNTRDVDWRLQDRLDLMESEMKDFRQAAASTQAEHLAQKETLAVYRARGKAGYKIDTGAC